MDLCTRCRSTASVKLPLLENSCLTTVFALWVPNCNGVFQADTIKDFVLQLHVSGSGPLSIWLVHTAAFIRGCILPMYYLLSQWNCRAAPAAGPHVCLGRLQLPRNTDLFWPQQACTSRHQLQCQAFWNQYMQIAWQGLCRGKWSTAIKVRPLLNNLGGGGEYNLRFSLPVWPT